MSLQLPGPVYGCFDKFWIIARGAMTQHDPARIILALNTDNKASGKKRDLCVC
jgi:hypothetical protein